MKAKSAKNSERKLEASEAEADEVWDYGDQSAGRLWSKGQPPWKRTFNQRIAKNGEEIWDVACDYFLWVESNPLRELKAMNVDSTLTKVSLPKMRAMTIEGLTVFMGITRDTWNKWGKTELHPDLADVVQIINTIIREQKFTGASADLFNASIIKADLGLADKVEQTTQNKTELDISETLINRLERLRAAAKLGSTEGSRSELG